MEAVLPIGATPKSPIACRALIAFWLVLAGAGAAAADPATEEPVSLGSIGPAPEAASRRLQIGGFAVLSALQDYATDDSSVEGSALAVSLFRPINDRLSVFAQLTAHQEEIEPFINASSEEGPALATEIDNLQIGWAAAPSAGLQAVFGKFDSPLGIERDDAPLNYEATRSFTYEFARPVKFTGVQLHESFSPHFEMTAIVANGWNADAGSGAAKTGALYAMWNPALSAHLGFGIVHGSEQGEGGSRTDYISTLLLQHGDTLVFGGEGVWGTEAGATIAGADARWFGSALFAHQRFAKKLAATVRGEYFRDRDGVLTGHAQTIRSLTLSPQYLLGGGSYGAFRYLERTSLALPEVSLKLDLRYDKSSGAVFPSNREGGADRNRFTTTLQAVVLF